MCPIPPLGSWGFALRLYTGKFLISCVRAPGRSGTHAAVVYCISVLSLADRRARPRAPARRYALFHTLARTRGSQVARALPINQRLPNRTYQRPNACMRVLAGLRSPPEQPQRGHLGLPHSPARTPPTSSGDHDAGAREVPPVPRSVCDLHPHPCVQGPRHATCTLTRGPSARVMLEGVQSS